jgi:hypothetical protein
MSSPQSAPVANPSPNASAPKVRLSFTAVKAIVTFVLIVALVLVVVQMYYPSVFPWNN